MGDFLEIGNDEQILRDADGFDNGHACWIDHDTSPRRECVAPVGKRHGRYNIELRDAKIPMDSIAKHPFHARETAPPDSPPRPAKL
jgi:hypothetical protein